jgi:hypothetical protein
MWGAWPPLLIERSHLMELDRVKELADDILKTGQALLLRDGNLYTVLFSIDENERITPVSVSLEDQNNAELISDLMKDLALTSEAIIVLMDTHFKWFEKGEEAHIIKGDPEVNTAISVIAHAKNGQSSTRQLIYVRDGEDISFANDFWQDGSLKGTLGKSPF